MSCNLSGYRVKKMKRKPSFTFPLIAEKKKKGDQLREEKKRDQKNYLDNAHQHVKGKEPVKERPENGRLGDRIKEVIEKGSEGGLVEDLR